MIYAKMAGKAIFGAVLGWAVALILCAFLSWPCRLLEGGAGATGVADIYFGLMILGFASGPRIFNYLFVL